MKLGVLDYGAGNLRSVLNAFEAIGAHANLVTRPEDFDTIDVLVFPGQGAFGDSVRILNETGLWEPLKSWLKAGKPYLGICLGYQLLFESSEESPGVVGLGVVPGKVRRFDPASGLKIPHMGWNVANWEAGQSAVWNGLPNPTHVYFVHSYYPEVQDESLALCRTDYGVGFISGIAKKNLVAVQFHPEKSQEAGLTLLRNALKVLEAKD
ncbi:MAG: imidazole glycerol phosphate synthase subunit HisH [Prosthecobacter sp.]|jgi:glutamine amidotransferase|uniref:imidazole glycerol phosphate synthase subunit HisH n=1 Tax=Prosthecobacter sp. TaxID=1965333 RepID=UPI0019E554ED|nr:imidazole glycerol phosphate synthase subunit HisH [Prosthecobacter sp.]MBE2285840.1 imidazole glycerol phosphate synthase subunit HisH [Prosthecobacter sp.]